MKKLSFILGVTGSGLILLVWLWFIGLYLFAPQVFNTLQSTLFSKPYIEDYYYNTNFLFASILLVLLSSAGLAGSLLVLKKSNVARWIMFIAGLAILLFHKSSIAFMFLFGGLIEAQLYLIPSIMLIFAVYAIPKAPPPVNPEGRRPEKE